MIQIEPMITLPDFDASEFDCKCGCGLNNMKPMFLWMLQQARTEARVPFIITSGSRCKKHNEAVGGKDHSEHLTGEAADVLAETPFIYFRILKAALDVGFKRIGLGPNYIHLGGRYLNTAQGVAWNYYEKG